MAFVDHAGEWPALCTRLDEVGWVWFKLPTYSYLPVFVPTSKMSHTGLFFLFAASQTGKNQKLEKE